MYPFIMPGYQGSPWDWWDEQTLDDAISAFNDLYGTEIEADQLHNNGLLTNPNMGPEQGNAYLDTVFMYMLPRTCFAFGLEDCMNAVVSVSDPIEEGLVGFDVKPIPADEYISLSSLAESPMKNIYLFDV